MENSFWDKGISKHVFHSKQATNKIGSKVHLPCTLSHQHMINLSWQFYKHKLDVKTLERIKELGLKRKFSRDGRNKARAWSSNKGAHQHLLWTLPKCKITKWNHTPIRMLLINIQSIKSKIDALLHHITLNDRYMLYYWNLDSHWSGPTITWGQHIRTRI